MRKSCLLTRLFWRIMQNHGIILQAGDSAGILAVSASKHNYETDADENQVTMRHPSGTTPQEITPSSR